MPWFTAKKVSIIPFLRDLTLHAHTWQFQLSLCLSPCLRPRFPPGSVSPRRGHRGTLGTELLGAPRLGGALCQPGVSNKSAVGSYLHGREFME